MGTDGDERATERRWNGMLDLAVVPLFVTSVGCETERELVCRCPRWLAFDRRATRADKARNASVSTAHSNRDALIK